MSSSFLARYRAGDSVRVWSELLALGAAVREPAIAEDAYAVARETMLRVRANVETVYQRLIQLGYQFWLPESAFVPPSPHIVNILADVEQEVGPLPLSLRAFYEVVGSVDFSQSPTQLIHWQRPERDDAPELSVLGEEDPLVVAPIEELRKDAKTLTGRHSKRLYFCFAPDEFHKANYSGGENYHVWLPNPNADFRIEGMYDVEEYFVEDLRATFLGGGFRGRVELLPDDEERCHKVSPQLDIVQSLAADLPPI